MILHAARERRFTVLFVLLLLLALYQLTGAALIKLKAGLAQILIARAWETSLESGAAVKPWPWADTWPVMRLSVPATDADLLVLRGASGNALAFGPGYELASALPGESGVTVIGGHRDTHFAFLGALVRGDRLVVQRMDGALIDYRVSAMRVVDSRTTDLPLTNSVDALLLVTCYPLDAIVPGGALRYVVVAEPIAAPRSPGRSDTSPLISLNQGSYRL